MDSLSQIAQEAGLLGRRAKKLFASGNVLGLFAELGLQLDATTYASPAYQALRTAVTGASTVVDKLVQAARAVEGVLASAGPDPAQLLSLVAAVYDACSELLAEFTAVKNALAALQSAPPGTTQQALAAFAQRFADALTQYLLLSHLRGFHNRLLGLLSLLGVVRDRVPPTLDAEALPTSDQTVKWSALTDLLRDPAAYLATTYGWHAPTNPPASTPTFAYRLLLANLERFATSLGVPAYFGPSLYDLTAVPELHLGSAISLRPATDGTYALDVVLTAPALTQTLTLPFHPAGWELELGVNADLEAGSVLRINWDGTVQASLAGASAALELSLTARLPAQTALYTLLNTPFGTSLGAKAIEVTVAFTTPALTTAGLSDRGQLRAAVSFDDFTISLDAGETDSFLSKLLGSRRSSVTSDLAIEWTQDKGLAVRGAQGLLPRKSVNLQLGLLTVNDLVLGLDPQDDSVALVSTFGATAKLGPVEATVEDVGFTAALSFAPGNLGPFGLAVGFRPPAGVGIRVKSDTLTGGGYLLLDPAKHQYAGAAQLAFKDKLKLSALGLLQTQLPGGRSGYSLVLLVTAQFNPVQLGLGFTLNGVGGVIGVNRHVDTSFLLGQVRNGGLDRLLFPANVLDNPAQALATVDSAFPVAEGQYVFGLMAKIGWGTPTLITLDVALLVELPSPVRLVILGILRAILPDLDHPILRLRADFVGVIDFAAQRVAFDASLHDSGLLMFDLSGDLAFRLYQGANPVFVLTAGGFHPYFQPPAGADLPPLRRLTLALASGNDFRLTLASYFAVTSNTVQFGSRLDLYVHLFSKCTLEGYLYFDALFQFNPFHVDLRLGGGLAIKWDGDDKLSISLRLAVTGPSPWHVWGTAEFELCWISYSHDIDETFGNRGSQPALPDVNVRALLQGALSDKRNWEMYVPGFSAPSPVTLRPADETANLLVDPSGLLTFSQRLVPLGYELQRYGNARPTNGARFDITSVTLGALTIGGSASSAGTGLLGTQDYFSPGQFRQMDDSQKLSTPSFQLMTNGFRLFGPNGYASGPGAMRGVEYELIVLTGAASTSAVLADNAQQRAAADGGSAAEGDDYAPAQARVATTGGGASGATSRVALATDTYQQLTKNSAIGRAYDRQAPSLRAPRQFVWHDEDYTVVYATNLAPFPGLGTFGSEAEATAALREQLRDDPSLAGGLLVVPAYQLAL